MTKVSDIYTLSFPNAKSVLVSGDIHGEFNQLVHKLCVQYAMREPCSLWLVIAALASTILAITTRW